METIILIVHLLIAVAMVGVILLQRSEGGALGIGGGGGGGGGFMSSRGTANVLTRTTSILAALFFTTSITLSVLGRLATAPQGAIDSDLNSSAPASEPAIPEPEEPAPPISQ